MWMDGLRVLWDGVNLRMRNGMKLKTPNYFAENLPPVILDGELW